MVERFLEQYEAVHMALLELRPEDDELSSSVASCDKKALKELTCVLQPFMAITEAMSSESKCTISYVHPLKHTLLAKLKKAVITSSAVKDARDAIVVNLQSRYNDEDSDILLKQASLLDPRFKTMPYLTDSERKFLLEHVTSHVIHITSKVTESSDATADAASVNPSVAGAG